MRLRQGSDLAAPDAVVYPTDHGEVAALLAGCARERIAVVPFGGGTSVVGGVEPLRGSFTAVVSLDLARSGCPQPLPAPTCARCCSARRARSWSSPR